MERADDLKGLDLAFDKLPIERALGVHWRIGSDCFTFHVTLKDQPLTRRGILSTMTRWDSSPRLSWKANASFRRCVDEEQIGMSPCRMNFVLGGSGGDWREDLFRLRDLAITRCYLPQEFGTIEKVIRPSRHCLCIDVYAIFFLMLHSF